MFGSKTATGIFICAILAAILLRAIALTQKDVVTHDESISYLAATGYESVFAQIQEGQPPAGVWVQAAEWKQFMQPDKNPSLTSIGRDLFQIGRDLAHFDIHPPLYFWVLYFWTLIFNVQVWTGPLLNTLLDIISILFLGRLGYLSLGNKVEAALVTFIWAVSPAVLQVTLEARQYSLVALITIAFIWQIIRLLHSKDSPRWPHYFFITLTTAAGILTHYHFMLVILASFFLLAIKLIKHDRRRLMMSIIALAGGGLLFLTIHPYFYLSLQSLASRQQLEAQYLSTSLDILRRIFSAASTFSGFLVYGSILQVIFFILSLSFIIWLSLVFLRSRSSFFTMLGRINGAGLYILYYSFSLYGALLLLYLTFLTPANGMNARHLSLVWPLFAFLPVLLLRFIPDNLRRIAGPLLCLFVFSCGLATVISANNKVDRSTVLDHASMIIVDTTHRGIIPRVLWYVSDNKPVLAADQAYLLNHPEIWSAVLEDQALYINDLSYDNTTDGRDEILEILRQTYQVEMIDEGRIAVGTIFRISKRN